MQRAVRDHGNDENVSVLNEVISLLELRQKQALKAQDAEKLRGIEGDAANCYFGAFNYLIVSQKADFIITIGMFGEAIGLPILVWFIFEWLQKKSKQQSIK